MLIARELPKPAHLCAKAWNRAENARILEAFPAYETVGIELTDPISSFVESEWIDSLLKELEGDLESESSVVHEIPVCYEMGEDIQKVSEFLHLPVEQIIAAHSGTTYCCAAVGFCPGFGYLKSLPSQLRGLPRLSSPRVRVEPGSVGITGEQTAVYPLARPGGWRIVGRTPLCLVDVRESYFPVSAGDLVRFHPIDSSEFTRRVGERL